MSKDNRMDILQNIGEEAVELYGYMLVDVELIKEAGNWYLRYYIDKPGGILLDDCQKVSEFISNKLDDIDPIPHSYILEVSSPGIERSLKKDEDFINAMGSQVEIKTFQSLEGKKVFSGELKDFSDNTITISSEKDYIIPKEKIASAKLKFEWNGG